MTAHEQPYAQNLRNLEFQQIVAFLESTDASIPSGAIDPAEIIRRFPELADIDVRDIVIDGKHGQVAGRIYRGASVGVAALVWVHGGAFIGGDLDSPEAHWVSLVMASQGFAVLSLDYHKSLRGIHYPVPSDDVLSGWEWATTHASELGVASGELHLGGASAGGNLVAGVTKRLRDGAGAIPSSVVLVYPIVHPELPQLSAELGEKLAADPQMATLSGESARAMNLQYAGSEAVFSDPYAFAPNGPLADQPPTYILNSEVDFLRASGEAYGVDLRNAGVDVTVETEPGTHHGHLNGPDEPGAFASIDRISTWLREHSSGHGH
jgi:acetyl esterase